MSREVLYRFNHHDYFRCLWKLLFKKASDAKKIKILVITPAFYLGGLLYLISAILNIYILKFLDYSVVLPLTSITYIWTFVLSYYTQKNYRDCLNRFGKYYYCSMIEIIIECKC